MKRYYDKSSRSKSILSSLGIFCIITFAAIGYGLNIYKFISSDFKAPYKREIIHGIGLIPIFGWAFGYITINEDESNGE